MASVPGGDELKAYLTRHAVRGKFGVVFYLMTASGTFRKCRDVRLESAKRDKADIDERGYETCASTLALCVSLNDLPETFGRAQA